MPVRSRPERAADPDSKRSRAKAKALCERKARLPPHLQEEFDELHADINESPPANDAPFAVSDESWYNATHVARSYPEFVGKKVGARRGRGHLFHKHRRKEAAVVNTSYANWVTTMEIAILETHDAPAE